MHKGGSSQIRTIAYKGGGGLILGIFVRTYYVDDFMCFKFYSSMKIIYLVTKFLFIKILLHWFEI